MEQLQDAILALETSLDEWEAAPTDAALSRLDASLRDAWRELDEAAGSPNPLFDRQRALYWSPAEPHTLKTFRWYGPR